MSKGYALDRVMFARAKWEGTKQDEREDAQAYKRAVYLAHLEGCTQDEIAAEVGVHRSRIAEIIKEQRGLEGR